MNKKAAFANARRVFPLKKPDSPSTIFLTDDGTGVVISAHDAPTTLVFHNRGDLWVLKGVVDAALGLAPAGSEKS